MISTFEVDYFAEWLLYFVVIGIVFLNVSLEFFRQRALAYFGALFVVPIYQVLLIVGSAMMGAVFFNEFAGLKAYELVFFIIAIMITMTGVGVMAFNLGKRLQRVKHLLKVALVTADKLFDGDAEGPAFPVWGGCLSRIFQNYYVQNVAFFFNSTFESVRDAAVDLGSEIKDVAIDLRADVKGAAIECKSKLDDAICAIKGDEESNEQKENEQNDETAKATENSTEQKDDIEIITEP